MRRTRQQAPDIRFAGTHFSDPFLEWLKGFSKNRRSTRDATKLSSEVLNYRHEVFPVRSVPVPDMPERVTLNRNYFKVQFANGRVNKDLTELFSEKGSNREWIGYGNAHDLGEFFEMAFHEILVNGFCLYAIEWKRIKVNRRYYTLPVEFNWVNPATAHIDKKNNNKYLIQKFSWISKFLNSYYQYTNHTFRKDETLIYRYPLLTSSPVSLSLKYLKELNQGIDFSLLQGQANVEPVNYSFELEKTRYRSSTEYWRKENITRIKVKRIFNQALGGLGVNLTTYYLVYAFAEYKKHLNLVREYFITEFNEQVIEQIRQKNGFKNSLQITYRGFVSDMLVNKAFSKYSKGEITSDEFLAEVKDNYDTDTF